MIAVVHYGVQVMGTNGNGDRVPMSEVYPVSQSYGAYGQDGYMDAATRMQEFYGEMDESQPFPIAGIYASSNAWADLFEEIGTAEPEAHAIDCDCRSCLLAIERMSNAQDTCNADCAGCVMCIPAV